MGFREMLCNEKNTAGIPRERWKERERENYYIKMNYFIAQQPAAVFIFAGVPNLTLQTGHIQSSSSAGAILNPLHCKWKTLGHLSQHRTSPPS